MDLTAEFIFVQNLRSLQTSFYDCNCYGSQLFKHEIGHKLVMSDIHALRVVALFLVEQKEELRKLFQGDDMHQGHHHESSNKNQRTESSDLRSAKPR